MFDVREFMAEQEFEPFEFTDKDGSVWQLPHIGTMTADDGARLMAGDYSAIGDADLVEALSKTPVTAARQLMREWLEHSGIEVDAEGQPSGKSSAPSRSSRSTARPSRPTSRSGASKSRKR